MQTLTANNAGTVPPSWSSFGFTTGASAPSLRGFNDAYTLLCSTACVRRFTARVTTASATSSTSTRFRTSIVGRIDTLLDGASATYGSDAIAGVVNVITKKEVQGLHANGSFGISQNGATRTNTLASADLRLRQPRDQGYNVYGNVEWQKNDRLLMRDRG